MKKFEKKSKPKDKFGKPRLTAGRKIRNEELEKFVLNFVRYEIIENGKFEKSQFWSNFHSRKNA